MTKLRLLNIQVKLKIEDYLALNSFKKGGVSSSLVDDLEKSRLCRVIQLKVFSDEGKIGGLPLEFEVGGI